MSGVGAQLRAHVAAYRERSERARAKHERAARSLRDDALTPAEHGALAVLAHVYDCEARRCVQWANSLELAAGEIDA